MIADRIASRIAWCLPRRVVYWCGLRILANSVDRRFQWAGQFTYDPTLSDALHRWEEATRWGYPVT